MYQSTFNGGVFGNGTKRKKKKSLRPVTYNLDRERGDKKGEIRKGSSFNNLGCKTRRRRPEEVVFINAFHERPLNASK